MQQDTPLIIEGGRPLVGTLAAQPSKNAALPIIAATLLSEAPVTLHGVPRLSDIETLLQILSQLGTRHSWTGRHSLRLHTPRLLSSAPPRELVAQLRASFTLLGALLARGGEARIGLPGGCTFSQRPVDQHLKALRAVGVSIAEEGGEFHARRTDTVSGNYLFEMLTVGGTQNAILAATLGHGTVVLDNCSTDTDVVDLAHFLKAMGANISGAGTATITVHGVAALHGGEYHIIPDRLEAGTLMIAAVATRGHLTLTGVRTDHLRAVSAKLREVGATVSEAQDGGALTVDARERELNPVRVTATEYPGFPTDLQPVIGALLATVPGTSVLTDRVYARTSHIGELRRLGAHIELAEHVMIVNGGPLHGAPVVASDIRSGAALVVAALAATGETVIEGTVHLNRGYEDLAARLTRLGAHARHGEAVLTGAMD